MFVVSKQNFVIQYIKWEGNICYFESNIVGEEEGEKGKMYGSNL